MEACRYPSCALPSRAGPRQACVPRPVPLLSRLTVRGHPQQSGHTIGTRLLWMHRCAMTQSTRPWHAVLYYNRHCMAPRWIEDLCSPTSMTVNICIGPFPHRRDSDQRQYLKADVAGCAHSVAVCMQQPFVDPFDEVFGSRGSSPDRPARPQADQPLPEVKSATN